MNKHYYLRLFLPTFLFIFGISNLFNYFKAGDFSILNLDVRGNINQLTGVRPGDILKGDIVHGKFRSQFTNLGIVFVRFDNQNRDSNDILTFKLKEEGQKNWYYEAKYKTDQFSPHKLFPFGFPVIGNSNGKNYEFVLESLNGATGSGIVIDNQRPVFIAKSTYTKNDLLKNINLLLYFVTNKFVNMFGDTLLLLNSLFFFLPLIFFIIYLFSKGASFQFLTSLAILFIFYDIFWLKFSHDFLFVGVLFLWGLTSYRFRFDSRIATVFALGFLLTTLVMLLFRKNSIAEQTAIWAYLFLCASIVQQVYEFKKHPKKLLTIENLVSKINIFNIVKKSFKN